MASSHFKQEQKTMTSDDCVVEIVFNKARITAARDDEVRQKMQNTKSIKLRFIRVKLPNGDEKTLATNLSQEEFSYNEICELYTLRWGIETVYDDLKNKLEIENFTGTKSDIIKQDIFATILLSNIINDIISESSENIKQKFKHEMQINRAFAVGILKIGLFDIFLEKSHRKRCQILKSLKEELLTELLPIRPGRHYYRSKKPLMKFSNVRKRTY